MEFERDNGKYSIILKHIYKVKSILFNNFY